MLMNLCVETCLRTQKDQSAQALFTVFFLTIILLSVWYKQRRSVHAELKKSLLIIYNKAEKKIHTLLPRGNVRLLKRLTFDCVQLSVLRRRPWQSQAGLGGPWQKKKGCTQVEHNNLCRTTPPSLHFFLCRPELHSTAEHSVPPHISHHWDITATKSLLKEKSCYGNEFRNRGGVGETHKCHTVHTLTGPVWPVLIMYDTNLWD